MNLDDSIKKRKEIHDLINKMFTDVINDTCYNITEYLTKCVKENTKVTTQIITKEGTNTQLISITFDNPIVNYTFNIPVMHYVDFANDAGVAHALSTICSYALRKYSNLMYDYFMQEPEEIEKVIKNIK